MRTLYPRHDHSDGISGSMDISVIIPCHNAGRYLREAVQSVLGQRGDFELLEVLIIDDHSDDELTRDAYVKLQEEPLVKLVTNPGPRGPGAARNVGLDLARGGWIAFLDADDVLTDGSLQMRCSAARQFPECKFIGGDYIFWNPDGTLEPTSFLSSRPRPSQVLRSAFEARQPTKYARPVEGFITAPLGNTGTMFLARDLVDAVGRFDTSLLRGEDVQYWIRCAALSDYVFIPHPLMHYRRHENSTMVSSKIPSGIHEIQSFSYFLENGEFKAYKRLIGRKIAGYYVQAIRFYRKNDQPLLAIKYCLFGLKYTPTSLEIWRNLIASGLGRR